MVHSETILRHVEVPQAAGQGEKYVDANQSSL